MITPTASELSAACKAEAGGTGDPWAYAAGRLSVALAYAISLHPEILPLLGLPPVERGPA